MADPTPQELMRREALAARLEPPDATHPAFDLDWRGKRARAPLKFNDEAKTIYLSFLARFGRMAQAARAADVSTPTIRHHKDPESPNYDPEFVEAEQEALALYRDRVRATAYKLAVEGVEEKVFGGRFKDEVIDTKRVYSPSLLMAELRRVDPEYREKAGDVNVNVNTGVMVAPAQPASEKEWEENNSGKDAPADNTADSKSPGG